MEFSFPQDLRVESAGENRVRIVPAGPPRKWVRLVTAAERLGVDRRTALTVGKGGAFSVRRVGGLWQADLLGVENYLTDSVVGR